MTDYDHLPNLPFMAKFVNSGDEGWDGNIVEIIEIRDKEDRGRALWTAKPKGWMFSGNGREVSAESGHGHFFANRFEVFYNKPYSMRSVSVSVIDREECFP